MTGMYRSIFVFVLVGGAALPQQALQNQALQKEVANGYHVDHPDQPAATPAARDKSSAKKAAARKKTHSNAKRLTSGK